MTVESDNELVTVFVITESDGQLKTKCECYKSHFIIAQITSL